MTTASELILEHLVETYLINGVVHLLAEQCERRAREADAEGDVGLGAAWRIDAEVLRCAAEDVGEPA